MSTDYFVVVPGFRWPTFKLLNEAFAQDGLRVSITPDPRLDEHQKACATDQFPDITTTLWNREVDLKLWIGHFLDEDFEWTVESLSELDAEFTAKRDDLFFSVSLRGGLDEAELAFSIMATLIRRFDGYGFEHQWATHGKEIWAAQLMDEVEGIRWERTAPDRIQAAAHRALKERPELLAPDGDMNLKVVGWRRYLPVLIALIASILFFSLMMAFF